MKTIDVFFGALIAALILFTSNIVTLFVENPDLTFGMIKTSAWVSIVGGAVLAFLKDFQAIWSRVKISKVREAMGGSAAPKCLAAAILATTLVGCAGLPISKAETVEQRAYAAYGTFVILQERVDILTSEGSALSRDRQLQLIGAVEAAYPTVDALLTALEEYRAARESYEAERIEKSAFEVIVSNLDRWATTAGPVMESLQAAVR